MSIAQRRPGPEPRRHSEPVAAATYVCNAQRRPGPETLATRANPRRPATLVGTAQRRPGPEPRRHFACAPRPVDVFVAQRRPGPEPRRHASEARFSSVRLSAQRRPGPEPRRHVMVISDIVLATTHAQRRQGPEPRRHGASWRAPCGCRRPLNEGRGLNPGDTLRIGLLGARRARSTKAGA